MAKYLTQKFKRATILLGYGYPHTYIAEKLKVHPNSVLGWAKELGYSLGSGDKRLSRRVSNAFRRFLRMRSAERRMFFDMLRAKGLLPKKVA